MDPKKLAQILEVVQNHRALLDEFEFYLRRGEADKLGIAVKGLMLSATFLDELISQPAAAIAPAILPIEPPQS